MHDNCDQEQCETAAQTDAKPGVPLALTRRQLLRAGFSVVGVGSALFADTLLKPNLARSVSVKASPVALRSFRFTVVTVNAKGHVVSREPGTARFFTADLGQGAGLDMVAIPGGRFLMGSPASELERSEREGPQHTVTVKPFFFGKYTVTYAQWNAVAALPPVKLKLYPHPLDLKGLKRPVDTITWSEALEFCYRLSAFTGRQYRLPTEAEWEYACRAGTTTPFHFGETITTDLANYRGTDREVLGRSGSYGQGPKGVYREQTTDVGSFPPNAFGLYDLHGNVKEWCLDHEHDNYDGAPTDGSAWTTGSHGNLRSMRGGNYYTTPGYCRAAVRFYSSYLAPGWRYTTNGGFRVVCATP